MRYKYLLGFFALVASTGAQLTSCASNPETIGSSSERLVTAATANYNVGGPSFANQSETSIAFAAGVSNPFTGTHGQWVVGFNTGNGFTQEAGWSYSQDGVSWTPQGISSGTAWGNPGASPFDGAAFEGWRSDPSLSAVTDPSLSEGGLRVMYTMLACTHGCGTIHEQDNDVIIALSRDGGTTWSHTAYVSGDSSHGGAHNSDNPWIATNPVSPYHSFVTWTNDSGTWLAQVAYSNPSDGGPITLSATNYTQPPVPTGKTIYHPRIAVGQYTDCSSNLHEAVFLAYATNFSGRCRFDGMKDNETQAYYFDMYDVPSNTWYGPFGLSSTPNWPLCVGGGTGTVCFPGDGGPGAPNCADNDARPHIALDPAATNGAYYVTHTVPGAHGTRVEVDFGTMGCSGTTHTSKKQDPNPCDPGPAGCTSTGPDGGPYIQDEWGPTIAYNYSGATGRAVVTYYGTRDDTSNVHASMYMTYSEDNGAHWSTPSAIAIAGTGQTIPWDYHLGDWSDYQSLTSNGDGGFLGAWGGDCRLGLGNCNMWSTLLQ